MADVVDIAQEQKYFDHALECREHSRQILEHAPEAAVSKGAAAGLRKFVADRPAAAPDEAVAFARFRQWHRNKPLRPRTQTSCTARGRLAPSLGL